MGAALRHAFDVLNINRMQTGIDTYGQGRCPFYLEPSVIVVITDGGKLTSNGGVQEDVSASCFFIVVYLNLLLNVILFTVQFADELPDSRFRIDERAVSMGPKIIFLSAASFRNARRRKRLRSRASRRFSDRRHV